MDEYGKNTVESVIRSEAARCREQDSLFSEESFMLSIRIRNEDGGKALAEA